MQFHLIYVWDFFTTTHCFRFASLQNKCAIMYQLLASKSVWVQTQLFTNWQIHRCTLVWLTHNFKSVYNTLLYFNHVQLFMQAFRWRLINVHLDLRSDNPRDRLSQKLNYLNALYCVINSITWDMGAMTHRRTTPPKYILGFDKRNLASWSLNSNFVNPYFYYLVYVQSVLHIFQLRDATTTYNPVPPSSPLSSFVLRASFKTRQLTVHMHFKSHESWQLNTPLIKYRRALCAPAYAHFMYYVWNTWLN